MRSVKTAKVTPADIDAAIDIFEALASLNNGRLPVSLSDSDDDFMGDKFDTTDGAACRIVIECLLNTYRKARIDRVVYSMAILLDPANKTVDPNAATLEHHQDIQALEAVREAITLYHAELDNRKDYALSSQKCLSKIEGALGTPWVPGASLRTETTR